MAIKKYVLSCSDKKPNKYSIRYNSLDELSNYLRDNQTVPNIETTTIREMMGKLIERRETAPYTTKFLKSLARMASRFDDLDKRIYVVRDRKEFYFCSIDGENAVFLVLSEAARMGGLKITVEEQEDPAITLFGSSGINCIQIKYEDLKTLESLSSRTGIHSCELLHTAINLYKDAFDQLVPDKEKSDEQNQ